METHTDEKLHLAKLHFIAEQEARLSCVSGAHDPDYKADKSTRKDALTGLEIQWNAAMDVYQNEYIERAGQLDAILAASRKTVPYSRYEEFVKHLYKELWAGMNELASEMVQIPLDMFNEMAKGSIDSSTLLRHHDLPLRDYDDVSVQMQDNSPIDWDDFDDDDDAGDVVKPGVDNLSSPAGLPMSTNLREKEKPIIGKLETAAKRPQIFQESRIWTGGTNWIKEIAETVEYAEPAKVIVGVIGSTGAGKSSVLNAIADEENILATNCMRASTAVATEISYNHGDSQYMAQIEFISPEEWEQELNTLLLHLQIHENVLTPAEIRTDPDIALVLDKILAVYPSLDEKDIFSTSVEDLIMHTSVTDLLGTTDVIEEDDARVFSNKLISYLDSRGSTGRRGLAMAALGVSLPKPATFSKEKRLWPLIRVVRIYVKAEALSTGAVLVDLPGFNDSNAARSQVAEEYMKRCSAHWVVTPINRAVDDKLAHELLSKNLKTQMQMDCAFNDITVICTKTDDISITETECYLRLDIPEKDLRDKLKEEIEAKHKELKGLEKEKENASRRLRKANNIIKDLGASQDAPGNYSMHAIPRITPQKKQWQEDNQEKGMGIESSPASAKTDEDSPISQGPTPQKSTDQQLSRWKSRTKRLHQRHSSLEDQTGALKEEICRGKAKDVEYKATIIQKCVEGRNDFAKQVMKAYFAQLKRELDNEGLEHLETQAGESENELPIFTVSSKAYQKLRGRFRTDAAIEGFTTLEQTGIPQLQRHCIFLTEKAREASARRFLHQVDQLMRSIGIWSGAANQSKTLDDGAKETLEKSFHDEIQKLQEVSPIFLLCKRQS
ncbi:hypothetical protein PHISCL_01249 [Aspergillus sclerotialis]|uniref:Dynamin N-terminal domain-containing protein n=1 Tax=Aspergillus sclerotialis TaxID=2070753 RepID=A0A3A2ZTF4_9EURO|nr:hypothetical protein PHISCL_01249 [Aspergillus sclerotialis]